MACRLRGIRSVGGGGPRVRPADFGVSARWGGLSVGLVVSARPVGCALPTSGYPLVAVVVLCVSRRGAPARCARCSQGASVCAPAAPCAAARCARCSQERVGVVAGQRPKPGAQNTSSTFSLFGNAPKLRSPEPLSPSFLKHLQINPNHPQIIPKSSPNHPQIIPKSSPNHPQIIPKSPPNHSQITAKSLPNHLQIIPKSSLNHPQIIPK